MSVLANTTEAFAGQVVTDVAATMSSVMTAIGHRLGLYAAMAHAGPLSSQVLAERTGLAERYVREWLNNQTAGGYVAYDPQSSSYMLPDAHVPVLADRERAREAGVDDNIRFEVADAKSYPRDGYDLICFMDCLHDMGDPVGAARHATNSLRPGGRVLLVEPAAGNAVEDNINPVSRLYYAASTAICTPSSLSQEVGLALGAQAGERRLSEVMKDAGFASVRRVAETPFNIVLEAALT